LTRDPRKPPPSSDWVSKLKPLVGRAPKHLVKESARRTIAFVRREPAPTPPPSFRRTVLDPREYLPSFIADALERPTPTGPLPSEAVLRPAPWLERLARAEPPLVVIPVYGAFEELDRCLAALREHTDVDCELLIVDDASPDRDRLEVLLAEYAASMRLEVHHNPRNLGFSGACNVGLERARRRGWGDVVLLNSDVQVGPGWLRHLRRAAHEHGHCASATAVSDNAGAFSVPNVGSHSPIPPHLRDGRAATLAGRFIGPSFPETPTNNAFCTYIRGVALRDVGTLDADAFPRGYGEENDWSMRARRRGWTHVVAGSCFVRHERAASFKHEKTALIEQGRSIVDERYPEYSMLVRSFVHGEAMTGLRSAYDELWTRGELVQGASRPRVLFVLHEGKGGTPATTRDLALSLETVFEAFLLQANERRIFLRRVVDGRLETLNRWEREDTWLPSRVSSPWLRTLYANVFDQVRPDLVHVRHLMCHSFDVAELASVRSIPLIVSFHDFYQSCPTVHLIDELGRYCGGVCTRSEGDCPVPSTRLRCLPPLKHGYVHEWRAEYRRLVVPHVSAFVTTCDEARRVMTQSLGLPESGNFHVIEHGRELDVMTTESDASGGRLRVLCPGNIDRHKGSEVFRDIARSRLSERVELHFLGTVSDELADVGVHHGSYDRESFPEHVARIRPHVGAILSIWAETYCHTLSELWASGVPVVGTSLGAVGERIERHGGGWRVDARSKDEVIGLLERLCDDRDEVERRRAEITPAAVRSLDEMTGDYAALYTDVLRQGRSLVDRAEAPIRVGLVARRDGRSLRPSTWVRVLAWLRHPRVARHVTHELVDPVRFARGWSSGGFDRLIIQRDAVPPAEVDAFIHRARTANIPFLLELDDDLWALREDTEHPEADDYRTALEALEKLAANAEKVLVSTAPIAERVRAWASDVEIFENRLSDDLWFRPLPDRRPKRGRLSVFYYGTPTHGSDLDLVADAFRGLRGVRLEVARAAHSEKHRHVLYGQPPPGRRMYPRFVDWLFERRPDFDCAIVPLRASVFNAAKSPLKLMECSALGYPTIVSPRSQFLEKAAHRETALFADDDPAAWRDALKALRDDVDLRHRIGRAARQRAEREFGLGATVERYLEIIESLRRT
jgi:GT2 family glycosyltransferase/glycosyltransferase involved in cell wall biosynthesis